MERSSNFRKISLIVLVVIGIVLVWAVGPSVLKLVSPAKSRTFDVTEWHQQPDDRYNSAKALVESKQLIGANSEDVQNLLGKPSIIKSPEEFGYIIGPSGVDDLWLMIKTNEGLVVRVWIKPD